jgi:hypothetical protein
VRGGSRYAILSIVQHYCTAQFPQLWVFTNPCVIKAFKISHRKFQVLFFVCSKTKLNQQHFLFIHYEMSEVNTSQSIACLQTHC